MLFAGARIDIAARHLLTDCQGAYRGQRSRSVGIYSDCGHLFGAASFQFGRPIFWSTLGLFPRGEPAGWSRLNPPRDCAGGADDPMSSRGREEFAMVERFDAEVDDLVETRVIVRRQFVASVITACLVAAVAGLIAVRPATHEAQQVAAHNYPVVRQPVYAEPSERMTAAASNVSSAAFDLP
jgi:hypothetical protein